MTSNSSAETDSLLGGITVVGCSTEGVTAAATSPSTNGASPVTENPPGITFLTCYQYRVRAYSKCLIMNSYLILDLEVTRMKELERRHCNTIMPFKSGILYLAV